MHRFAQKLGSRILGIGLVCRIYQCQSTQNHKSLRITTWSLRNRYFLLLCYHQNLEDGLPNRVSSFTSSLFERKSLALSFWDDLSSLLCYFKIGIRSNYRCMLFTAQSESHKTVRSNSWFHHWTSSLPEKLESHSRLSNHKSSYSRKLSQIW